MQKAPVNSLNLEHLTEMCIALDKLHAEGELEVHQSPLRIM